MSAISDYLENSLIDALFRGLSYTFPSTIYIALCTATPTDADTGSTITEVATGNYARQSLACSTANWSSTNSVGGTENPSSGTDGTTSNNVAIAWTGVTWSATVVAVALCDAATNGNMLFYGALDDNKTVSSGDTVTFDANTLSIQLG